MTGAEARAIRKKLGLDQAELAAVIGLSPTNGERAVSRWETEPAEVRRPTALLLRYFERYGLPETALAG